MKTGIYKLISGVKQSLSALALTLVVSTAHSQTQTVVYTGAVQTLTINLAGNYRVECWGANGGSITSVGGGGIGGYSMGEINIAGGTVLNIFVGGQGQEASGLLSGNAGAGGWNGGGGGSKIGVAGSGGGGATDIRIGGTAASDRVIVAGGGGGAAGYYTQTPNNLIANGGNGGGLSGANGNTITSGGVITIGGGAQGATGSTPGMASVGSANGTATGGGGGAYSASGSSAGQQGTGGGPGGAAGNSGGGATGCAAGGGGGYAGGAGGEQSSNGGCAGGGGSGYIGGVSNGITVQFGQTGFVTNPDIDGNGYVRITRLCDVDATASSYAICIGDQVVLSTNAGSGIIWSTGATTPSITVAPTSNTSYTVSGLSSSTLACTNTIVLTVTVHALPNVSAASVPSVVCVGSTATLNAFGAGTYTWSNALSGWSTTVAPPATGVYSVTGTDGNGCKNQATVEVTVNTNSLDVTPPVTICSGSSQSLTASGGAGSTSYTWFPQANFPTIIVSPTVTTTYVVAATDIHNCLITGSVEVTVVDRPNIIASVDRDQICRGESVTLSATGGDNYTWSNGLTGPTHNVQLNADVTYTYAVTGSDANGCTGTGTTAVVVGKCTGMDELANGLMRISPNPSAGIFQLTFEEKDSRNIRVTDLTGKLIYEGKSEDSDTVLDLSGYPGGVYSVQVITASSSITHKLIKE